MPRITGRKLPLRDLGLKAGLKRLKDRAAAISAHLETPITPNHLNVIELRGKVPTYLIRPMSAAYGAPLEDVIEASAGRQNNSDKMTVIALTDI